MCFRKKSFYFLWNLYHILRHKVKLNFNILTVLRAYKIKGLMSVKDNMHKVSWIWQLKPNLVLLVKNTEGIETLCRIFSQNRFCSLKTQRELKPFVEYSPRTGFIAVHDKLLTVLFPLHSVFSSDESTQKIFVFRYRSCRGFIKINGSASESTHKWLWINGRSRDTLLI